ncbi:MAG: Re/Si-specific NAD(P)(+) transhydrogenase subunit alpha [Bacteroidetes bacterium]|nr:Re/Si-specific NAD(P)(+) transhydrogenase subunit alpha [Bacteroidota bacterium]MCH8523596.1 Re/Si-specific NAD(P)(+) transhydrogenase subunit alpha [Balneolales bacterium]
MIIVGVPKETVKGEKRVALNPDIAAQIMKLGAEVRIEKGAGAAAHFTDEAYEAVGVKLVDDAITGSDIVLKVQKPDAAQVAAMKEGAVLVSFLWAAQNRELIDLLNKHNITALGMEAVPRITRAQKMDALSSMSSIAGYKAVLLGADNLGKYLPMMMTAAGTIAPAKVLIVGAGVAGLQAIATARRLGAVVEAFDVRPAVKEQVESLGAKFVDIPLAEEDQQTETKGGYAKELSEASKQLQKEAMHERVIASDIVITTALIPGKPAPKLIFKETVAQMAAGSVIVDLAAEQGGNCELTKADEVVISNNVKILGPTNLPAELSLHSSQLYARNVFALLQLILSEEGIRLDFEDQVIHETTVTHDGQVHSPVIRGLLGLDG